MPSKSGAMFRKSKSKVLVDCASEEDDMSWHYHHSYKVKRRMGRNRWSMMFDDGDDRCLSSEICCTA